jgi:hypothetical protein
VDGTVAEGGTEVRPIEQVARKFAVAGEIVEVESVVVGNGVESETDVALVEEVEGGTVEADVGCWRERVGSEHGG